MLALTVVVAATVLVGFHVRDRLLVWRSGKPAPSDRLARLDPIAADCLVQWKIPAIFVIVVTLLMVLNPTVRVCAFTTASGSLFGSFKPPRARVSYHDEFVCEFTPPNSTPGLAARPKRMNMLIGFHGLS